MKKTLFVLATFLLNTIVIVQPAFASAATIALSPNNGSYDKSFTINMVIDGNGDKFNAAQATVTVSSNLEIQDLELGDCNFSFLKTPTIQDPSFAGIIISTYSTKCTAYTLTLSPIQKGKATITLSKGSIKRYGDAKEILSSIVNGSYTLTGVTKNTLNTEAKNTSQKGLYTLYLKVSTSNKPVQQANVTLNAVSKKNTQQATTDNSGIAHFSNLKGGVYDAIVKQGLNKVGETIVNISGQNYVLALTINLDTQKNNPLMKAGTVFATFINNPLFLVVTLLIGIILGLALAVIVIKISKKRKNN